MTKYFFFILLISVIANAEITLEQLSKKPTCRAKDFLIWQFLRQNITPQQAKEAYAQSTGKNYKLKREYLKRDVNPELNYKKLCRQNRDLFSIEYKECFQLALSTYKTLKMSKEERLKLAKRVESPNFIELLKIQNEPYSASSYKKVYTDNGFPQKRKLKY